MQVKYPSYRIVYFPDDYKTTGINTWVWEEDIYYDFDEALDAIIGLIDIAKENNNRITAGLIKVVSKTQYKFVLPQGMESPVLKLNA